jgi:hypothetical protein
MTDDAPWMRRPSGPPDLAVMDLPVLVEDDTQEIPALGVPARSGAASPRTAAPRAAGARGSGVRDRPAPRGGAGHVAAVVFAASLVLGFGIALMMGPQDLRGGDELAGMDAAVAGTASSFSTPLAVDPGAEPDDGDPQLDVVDSADSEGPPVLYVPGDPLETEVAVLAPGDTRIQVLDGRRDDGAAYEAALARLEELGYRVVASGPAVRPYTDTTVFFTTGNELTADMLRDSDARFAVIESNTRGLSEAIELHIVIGDDWAE